jgi:MFS family permease
MLDAPLISIFFLGMLGCVIQSVLSPFFPGEAKDKGVSSTVIGLIFGIQPIVASICSPIFGMILFKVGRKRVLLISAFMLVRIIQACSSFSFALVPNFNKDAFIAVGLLSRTFQGVGGAGCAISIVAIISNDYRDEMEKLFGIQQTLIGVAMIIGPVIGLALFKIGGFSCIFYVLSVIFTGCLVFLSYYLPPDKEILITKEKISWSVLLRVKVLIR